MILTRGLVLGVMMLSGIATNVFCQDLPMTECLQFPIYDDGSGVALYIMDEYDQNCDYSDTALVWADDTESFPQVCPNCGYKDQFTKNTKNVPPANDVTNQKKLEKFVRGTDRPLRSPLPLSFKFGQTLPNEFVFTDAKEQRYRIQPKKGIKVLMSRWVYVKPTGKDAAAIPVKLYAVAIDFSATGIPMETYKAPQKVVQAGFEPVAVPSSKPSQRIIQIGFEMAAMPASENPPVTALQPTQIKAGNKFSGTVNLDSESGDFFVVTKSPLF